MHFSNNKRDPILGNHCRMRAINSCLSLNEEEPMDKLPGARFWLPMHPECAQNKTLISNTERAWPSHTRPLMYRDHRVGPQENKINKLLFFFRSSDPGTNGNRALRPLGQYCVLRSSPLMISLFLCCGSLTSGQLLRALSRLHSSEVIKDLFFLGETNKSLSFSNPSWEW